MLKGCFAVLLQRSVFSINRHTSAHLANLMCLNAITLLQTWWPSIYVLGTLSMIHSETGHWCDTMQVPCQMWCSGDPTVSPVNTSLAYVESCCNSNWWISFGIRTCLWLLDLLTFCMYPTATTKCRVQQMSRLLPQYRSPNNCYSKLDSICSLLLLRMLWSTTEQNQAICCIYIFTWLTTEPVLDSWGLLISVKVLVAAGFWSREGG